jgi:hypothetical protein
LAPSTVGAATLHQFLGQLGIAYDPIELEAAYLAGQTFKRYRLAGGPRQHLGPDFLITAHAQTQANRLLAMDRGYLRRWFLEVQLVSII